MPTNTSSKSKRLVAIGAMVLALVVGSAGPAHAQAFVSPFIGTDFGGDSGCPELTTCEERHVNVGIAVGGLGSALGAELELGYAKDFFGEIPAVSSSVLTLMGNAMLAPRFGPAQPYGLIGVGLIKTNVEFSDASLLDSHNNDLGFDIGGGLILFLGERVGIRGDIRYFHAFQDLEVLGLPLGDTKLDFGRASAGLVVRF